MLRVEERDSRGAFPTRSLPDLPAEIGTQIGLQKYTYTLKQDGDKITGKADSDIAGQKRQVELTDVLLNNPNIAGYTYTQLTDVEQEVNGVYTYDRKPKFAIERLKTIFGAPAAIEKTSE